MKWVLLVAIVFGSSAFMLDAFFAHGLKSFLGETYTDAAEHALTTASRYQLTASIFLLVLILLYHYSKSRFIWVAEVFTILGVLNFSGTLYLKYLLGFDKLAKLAPLGGISFMLSFLALLPLLWALN